MTNLIKPPTAPLGWKKSFLWLVLAVASFHLAYSSLKFPVAGLLIFGYALGLVKLADQPNVRRAFYFGLATGLLCYAPQLFFLWRIFNIAAVVLWLMLAFWIGLFTAIICGCILRLGKTKTAWLIPIIWTGTEYFRSELYYLKFSWMSIGYSLSDLKILSFGFWGMYGIGFLEFSIATILFALRFRIALAAVVVIAVIWAMTASITRAEKLLPTVSLVGVQMESPPEHVIPKMLDQALAKNANAPIFVLSEYTLGSPPPDSLKNWCREHARFLVVGGMDHADGNNFYNTAFVIGTNGEIIFKQVKSVPIQFFNDGLRAPEQKVWNSPWGKIGICICYDLSYTRVTDELVRQGAQLLIVPTMDVESWGRHQHELHSRVTPVRAAEYGLPIFRVASSGISQAVTGSGRVVAQTSIPGNGEIFSAQLRLPARGALPLDRYLAPVCVGITGLVTTALLLLVWQEKRIRPKN